MTANYHKLTQMIPAATILGMVFYGSKYTYILLLNVKLFI